MAAWRSSPASRFPHSQQHRRPLRLRPSLRASASRRRRQRRSPTTPALLDITLVGTTGVTDDSDPASAIVNSCATGWIRQDANATGVPPAGDVNQTILNGAAGDVHVLASAADADTAGDATATAQIWSGSLIQIAVGEGTVQEAIDNEEILGVSAIANATGTGAAVANALIVATRRVRLRHLVGDQACRPTRPRPASPSPMRPTRRWACLPAPTLRARPRRPMRTWISASSRSPHSPTAPSRTSPTAAPWTSPRTRRRLADGPASAQADMLFGIVQVAGFGGAGHRHFHQQ